MRKATKKIKSKKHKVSREKESILKTQDDIILKASVREGTRQILARMELLL